jgi:hypothetical protein
MDNLENGREVENEDASVFYTHRMEILFDTEFPVEKETFKNFFLVLLGNRFINLKIKTKKHAMTDYVGEPEK